MSQKGRLKPRSSLCLQMKSATCNVCLKNAERHTLASFNAELTRVCCVMSFNMFSAVKPVCSLYLQMKSATYNVCLKMP